MSVRSRLPLVTLLLIGANIAAAFSLIVDPDLVTELGFRSNQPRLLAAFTSLFLHANLIHLLGNMVFLAAVGAAVELATGSIRFVIVYLVGGLAGVFLHFMITRRTPDPVPFVGASGCIASCAAYYSVRYTRLRVPLAPKLAISVAAVTGIWLALQVVGVVVKFGDRGGTSFWAHIGGFVAGALLSLIFSAPDLEQVKLGHEVLDQMNARGPAALAFAAEEHLKHHPKDVKVLWELADAREALGEESAQYKVLLRLLEFSSDGQRAQVLRRICKMGRATSLPSLRRLQMADQCCEFDPEVTRTLLKSVIEGSPEDTQRPDAMLALITLDRADFPESASQLLADLTQSYPLHPATELARKRGWVI